MDEDLAGSDAGSAPDLIKHTPGGSGALSVADAARAYADWRAKQAAGANNSQRERERSEPPEGGSAEPPPAAEQSAEEADATSPGTEPNRDDEQPDLDDKHPLIEPPASWTDEPRQHWNKLDPATQAYLVEYDKKTSAAVSRAQHESAEQLKGLQAREQAMEQARLQFEQLSAAALQDLQRQLAGEFADIRTMEDVEKLATNDWARYLRWDVFQKNLAAKMAVQRDAQMRQQQEQRDQFSRFALEADKKFIERNPEFADPEKAGKIQAVAIAALRDVGFSEEELQRHWNGQDVLSMRDPRVQSMFADAARYRLAQEAVKKVSAKPLPPVQRPGVSHDGTPDRDAQIKSLQRQLDRATGVSAIRLATQLTQLQREAQARRG